MTQKLAIAFNDSNSLKKKAYKDKKCFNYHKLSHFRCDYYQFDRKLAKIGGPSIKEHINNKSGSQTPYQANQTTKNFKDSNDKKPFTPGPVGKA